MDSASSRLLRRSSHRHLVGRHVRLHGDRSCDRDAACRLVVLSSAAAVEMVSRCWCGCAPHLASVPAIREWPELHRYSLAAFPSNDVSIAECGLVRTIHAAGGMDRDAERACWSRQTSASEGRWSSGSRTVDADSKLQGRAAWSLARPRHWHRWRFVRASTCRRPGPHAQGVAGLRRPSPRYGNRRERVDRRAVIECRRNDRRTYRLGTSLVWAVGLARGCEPRSLCQASTESARTVAQT